MLRSFVQGIVSMVGRLWAGLRRMVRAIVPSRSFVSDVLELAGLGAVVTGIWLGNGAEWGLIAAGVAAVVYAVALDRKK